MTRASENYEKCQQKMSQRANLDLLEKSGHYSLFKVSRLITRKLLFKGNFLIIEFKIEHSKWFEKLLAYIFVRIRILIGDIILKRGFCI